MGVHRSKEIGSQQVKDLERDPGLGVPLSSGMSLMTRR